MDRAGWGRGEVSRRAKAGLKGTRKEFYFLKVTATSKVTGCVHGHTKIEASDTHFSYDLSVVSVCFCANLATSTI